MSEVSRLPEVRAALLARQRALAAAGRDHHGRPRHRHGRAARRRPEAVPRRVGRGAGAAPRRGAWPGARLCRPPTRSWPSSGAATISTGTVRWRRCEPPPTPSTSRPTGNTFDQTVAAVEAAIRAAERQASARGPLVAAAPGAVGSAVLPSDGEPSSPNPPPADDASRASADRITWFIRATDGFGRFAWRLFGRVESRASRAARARGPAPGRREPRLERRRAAHRVAGSRRRSAAGSTGSASRRRSTGRSSDAWLAANARDRDRARRGGRRGVPAGPACPRRGPRAGRLPGGDPEPDRRPPGGQGRARDPRPADRRPDPPGRRGRHATASGRAGSACRTRATAGSGSGSARRSRSRPPAPDADRRAAQAAATTEIMTPDRGAPAGAPARGLRERGSGDPGKRRARRRPAALRVFPVPRAILERDGNRRGGPDRHADRLLLRRPRGDRQGQGSRRRRQGRPTPSARSSTTRASSATSSRSASSTVETLDDVDHGAAVVIRAHGVRPEVMERADARGLEVIDGTCTWVIQEQRELVRLVEEGYTIVLLGTPQPPRGRRPARLRAGRDRRRRGGRLGAHPAAQEDGAHLAEHPAALEVRAAGRLHGRRAATSSRSSTRSARSRSAARRTRSRSPARSTSWSSSAAAQREHEGADPAVRDRRNARDPDRRRARP